jgi:hypothetical protein
VQPWSNTNAYGSRYVERSGWSSGWSAFFWIRLVIALAVVGISLLGACVSALSR